MSHHACVRGCSCGNLLIDGGLGYVSFGCRLKGVTAMAGWTFKINKNKDIIKCV